MISHHRIGCSFKQLKEERKERMEGGREGGGRERGREGGGRNGEREKEEKNTDLLACMYRRCYTINLVF